ncbi:IS5 family transposase [Cellulomonas carbonis]|uniref:Transposase n=1 Tax=Cellulomonas carbonis T26 TaxID=947969 RepID=A0A0A0BXK8_9CELL|nr:IS5 family transposase [Cellulomonas carbonis]KGM11899.1 hypothetical protein N868_05005 [Cellulomonas carbonis T26]
MAYPSDLTDEQWALLWPVFSAPGKRGRRHSGSLRTVVDGMLYIAHTGCQWRYLPECFGPWTRVWSQFRRWSANGTWARALTALHTTARTAARRREAVPSMVVIDTHLARGASNGGRTFHDRGGPYGRTKGAKRVVAVDVTGLPVAALVVPASTHENHACDLVLEHLAEQRALERLELALVDRGVTAAAAHRLGRRHGVELRRVGWEDKQPVFRPLRHAWRVEVAHARIGRSRSLAKSFENTTASATAWLQVACVADILRVLAEAQGAAGRRRVRHGRPRGLRCGRRRMSTHGRAAGRGPGVGWTCPGNPARAGRDYPQPVREVPPRFPWEIPVESDALVGGALAVARPAASTDTEARLNGLQDAMVAERYQALRALVWERAGGDQSALERLLVLEESDAEVSWTRWQTSLSRCGVNDDAVVIEAARAVWEALGPNAYALHFKHRPRTWRGFQEGRTWLQVGVLGCVALIFAAFITDERAGVPWWIWLPAVVGWPLLVWRIFIASYRRRARVGGRELPHL